MESLRDFTKRRMALDGHLPAKTRTIDLVALEKSQETTQEEIKLPNSFENEEQAQLIPATEPPSIFSSYEPHESAHAPSVHHIGDPTTPPQHELVLKDMHPNLDVGQPLLEPQRSPKAAAKSHAVICKRCQSPLMTGLRTVHSLATRVTTLQYLIELEEAAGQRYPSNANKCHVLEVVNPNEWTFMSHPRQNASLSSPRHDFSSLEFNGQTMLYPTVNSNAVRL